MKWEIKKLGEIGVIFNGNSINEQEKKRKYTGISSGLPFIATKDVAFGTCEVDYENGVKIPIGLPGFKVAHKGAVLICAEGGSAGKKLAQIDRDVCFGNKLFAIETQPTVNSRFVFYWYQSPDFIAAFRNQVFGLIGGISSSKFKDLPIPLPPLHEQKRIVAILDEVFAHAARAKENAEKNLTNAKALFESYLQNIFANPGKDWEEKPLAELCDKNRVITYGVIKLGAEDPNGIPCLRTSNVRWLRIETEGMKKIAPALSKEYSRTILRGSEVLVNVRGTLGGVAVVSSEMAGWNVSREVAVVPVNASEANPEFISYFIGAGVSQKWLGNVKKGAAYIGINIEDLRLLPINMPKSATEQQSIVTKLDTLSAETKKLEAIYTQKLSALEELKKSVLKQAFEGRL